MLQNSYDNYTQKPQLNAKLKVLRKIIAFVFAINMLITRFFGGPAGTQLRQAEVFTDSSASQTYVTDSVSVSYTHLAPFPDEQQSPIYPLHKAVRFPCRHSCRYS